MERVGHMAKPLEGIVEPSASRADSRTVEAG